ncbi:MULTISPECIES: ATP-binding protein [unclassified Rhodococcus (in: high G+C Gram-positive bacteria)]|uniref:ATP-binding protein n=1 Tax=unclassified Rhodococcus (in: high G+C Gram-positive bacteria) TaxID=192944 RepID=UPI0015960771|nr:MULTISPECIES: ATP-binding protein [unclassified Rhodococcus (in: high G+C Gram-positive bacteria)]
MLGRQQIAGIPSAISELFKNAHDAYATTAAADFIRYRDTFILRDDGHGMSRSDFELRWLTLGTSSKSVEQRGPLSESHPKRAILGEKGIGRLAIAAIGPQTLVISKAIGHPRIAALVHWGVFELAHADLSQLTIPVCEIQSGETPDIGSMGKQILDNLESLMTEDDKGLYARVKTDIEKWCTNDPFSVSEIAGFKLAELKSGTAFVILPTSPDLKADLESLNPRESPTLLRTLIGFANTMTPGHAEPELKTIFRDHRAPDDIRDLIEEQEFFTVEEFLRADHHFQGDFDEYGQFSGTVSIFGGEPISFPLPWRQARGAKTQCGPFSLNLAYIQGRQKQSRLEPNEYFLISEKLERYGGLYLYRDGIRVLPYGDNRFDWLDVELRRTKSASDHFFSHRRMFGAVEISRKNNSKLREKAGREGFATNEAYRQFRSILENFLIMVAAEFFREGGTQTEIYDEGRIANERMENARRVRSKQVRARRSEYSTALDRFFDLVDSGQHDNNASEISNSVRAAIERAQQESDPDLGVEHLVRAELKARADLRDLIDRLQVKRPRGVALSPELTRRTLAYEKTRAEILSSTVEPTEREIQEALGSAGVALNSALHRRLRFDEHIDDAVSEAKSESANARRELSKLTVETNNRSKELARKAQTSVDSTVAQVVSESAATDVSMLSDKEFSFLCGSLEGRVRDSAAVNSEIMRSVTEQLASIAWVQPGEQATTVSLLDQLEQLEARVESLTERAAQDFELVQIGMAVNIVTHEFENSIRSVRDNLRRLRKWAQQNSELRPLYTDLRASFDHLDSYLKLFTPLHRRLYREPAEIRGVDLIRYLNDVFERKLESGRIDLQSSQTFEGLRVRMFPSTLYPVLVNLIDNAIYWLSEYSGPRKITLDKIGNKISVTDSGRGVKLGDEESVFEQGFSRKPTGSGYGLYVAREVLRRDGADIELAASSPDRGARFEIVLPNQREE